MSDLIIELKTPRVEVEKLIRSLIEKQLFSGAMNWREGLLYSVESHILTADGLCPHCETNILFTGKESVQCAQCHSEVFLTKHAAANIYTKNIYTENIH